MKRLRLKVCRAWRWLGDRIYRNRTKRYWANVDRERALAKQIIFDEHLLNRVHWVFAWQGLEWCRLEAGSWMSAHKALGKVVSGLYAGGLHLEEDVELNMHTGKGPHIAFRHYRDAVDFAEKYQLHVDWVALRHKEEEMRADAEYFTVLLMRAQAIRPRD